MAGEHRRYYINPGKPWLRLVDQRIMMAYLSGETAADTANEVGLLRDQVIKIQIKARKLFGTSWAHGTVGPALREGYLRLSPNLEWGGRTPGLTRDETSVLEGLAADVPLVRLPEALHLAPGTVAHAERSLKNKLGASSLVELVRAGYEWGLLQL